MTKPKPKRPLPTEPTITEVDGLMRHDGRGVDPRYVPMKMRKPPVHRGVSAKLLRPSPALAAIVGKVSIARTRVVGHPWPCIARHHLQDPAGRRRIAVDDKLRAVFGCDRVSMFGLNRLLTAHLTDENGEGPGVRLRKATKDPGSPE